MSSWGIALSRELDEVSLSLVADAWSRTYRSRAVTFAESAEVIETRNAVRILPDRVATSWPAERRLSAIEPVPAHALDKSLQEIAARYGNRTTNVVAMQLEYAR